MSKYVLSENDVKILSRMVRNANIADMRRTTKRPSCARVTKPERYRVKSFQADHIVCRTWDGTTEGTTDVLIAKPYMLRYSTPARSGYSYQNWGADYQSRTSNRSAAPTSENQVVVPAYVVNDQIWAIEASTGVANTTKIDMNLDGRTWAKASQ